jgi:4-hydroxy-3-methylbut-2-enyl diphosphate reductase
MEETYFRKGFGLKTEVKPLIDAEYHSALVEQIRASGYQRTFADVTVKLAREFGFCYGVDRAVDYAYETVREFPGRRIYLVGEIIHNPHVNARMTALGIRCIHPGSDGRFDFSEVVREDVVIIPAFGVTLADFEILRGIGCVLVDTTCGSVLVVWKRVEQYARDGFTAVIHGKYTHEESRATASQVNKHPGGKYLIVRDMAEAEVVCDYIVGSPDAPDREAFLARFAAKASPGFDPDRDLERVGMANQTTMLAGESLLIGGRIRQALEARYGEDHARECFRAFDTLCSATQERQDAVADMMKDPPDVMIVVGGYNSSNTNHLAHLCRQHTRTFHVDDASKIDVESGVIRHKPGLGVDDPELAETDWLPEGPFSLGITAGASTPNNKIGEALLRVLQSRGIDVDGSTI